MTIKGTVQEEVPAGYKLSYEEYGIGDYERSFTLPDEIDRDGIEATMKDGEFLAEAARVGLDVDPATAEEVEELLKRFAAYPPEILHKAQDAMGR